MRPRKARPGDERLIHDETADWGERSSALSRLAADGRLDLEPVARQWLQDPDPYLAGEGLIKLLIYWRNSPRAHEYVEAAIRWLEMDEDPNKRWAAASALSECLYLRGAHAETIIPALLRALEQDEDGSVQEECYRALLRQVVPEEAPELSRASLEPFDRATDVRWELLAPLRGPYSKN